MKLASYADGSRDGQLVVVSRDLASAHYANGIASRMQQVLDDWGFLAPQLEDLYSALNQGRARHAFAFEPARCAAPLPRAFLWASAQTGEAADEPAMVRGPGDLLFGACQPVAVAGHDLDAAPGLAVITGDIPMGASAEQALDGVRLLMLVNELSLRPGEPGTPACTGAQGQAAAAFSPVAVTPDELGPAWRDGRVHLRLESAWNNKRAGEADAGEAMRWHFGRLVAHLARTRPVAAGGIVGSGALLPRDAPRAEAGTLRVEMKNAEGRSVFGAIEQPLGGHGPGGSGAEA